MVAGYESELSNEFIFVLEPDPVVPRTMTHVVPRVVVCVGVTGVE